MLLASQLLFAAFDVVGAGEVCHSRRSPKVTAKFVPERPVNFANPTPAEGHARRLQLPHQVITAETSHSLRRVPESAIPKIATAPIKGSRRISGLSRLEILAIDRPTNPVVLHLYGRGLAPFGGGFHRGDTPTSCQAAHRRRT